MPDYINRDELLKMIHQNPVVASGERCAQILEAILNAPKADVVSVVHCRDCKHYHAEEAWCDEHSHFVDYRGAPCRPWEGNEWKMFDENDFCSNGEMKEKNDEKNR